MAVRGFRPELEPLTEAASPLTTSAGPKDSASRMPLLSASAAVILPTISTLSRLKPATTLCSEEAPLLFSTLPPETTRPMGRPPLPTPPLSANPPPLMPATAP